MILEPRGGGGGSRIIEGIDPWVCAASGGPSAAQTLGGGSQAMALLGWNVERCGSSSSWQAVAMRSAHTR